MTMGAIFAINNYHLTSVHYYEDPSHIHFLNPLVNTKILP